MDQPNRIDLYLRFFTTLACIAGIVRLYSQEIVLQCKLGINTTNLYIYGILGGIGLGVNGKQISEMRTAYFTKKNSG